MPQPDSKAHRTRVLKTSEGKAGICSCGYVTPKAISQEAIELTLNDHVVSSLRRS